MLDKKKKIQYTLKGHTPLGNDKYGHIYLDYTLIRNWKVALA